jgi:hypothetical protein
MNNKPVAWLWTKDGKPQSALLHEPDTVPSDPYWKDKGFKAIPLYTHPVKELHLSLQKSKQTGELLAVTYTDDEHRIVEVLWQRPPVKEQDTDCQYCKQGCIRCDARKQLTDEEILECWNKTHPAVVCLNAELPLFARAILRKASEK